MSKHIVNRIRVIFRRISTVRQLKKLSKFVEKLILNNISNVPWISRVFFKFLETVCWYISVPRPALCNISYSRS